MSRRIESHRLTFEYLGLRITVSADDASDLLWLGEFLSPWFQSGGRAAALKVSARINIGRFQQLLDQRNWMGAPGARCFTLDSANAADYPVLKRGAGELIVRDDQLRAFYVLAGKSEIQIIGSGSRGCARVAAMRVIRELATLRGWQTGAVLHHAAAVEISGRVVLFVGHKGAGKTTLLLSALRLPQSRLLSNDRVFLSSRAANLRATGMPTVVSVKPRTVEMNAHLDRAVTERRFDHTFTIAECQERPGANGVSDGRHIDVSPAQFCAALGREAIAEGDVAAIVWPQISAARDDRRINRLSAEDIDRRIVDGLFPVQAEQGVFADVIAPHGVDPWRGVPEVTRCLARVPNYGWRIDQDVPPDPWTMDTVKSIMD